MALWNGIDEKGRKLADQNEKNKSIIYDKCCGNSSELAERSLYVWNEIYYTAQ